MVILLILSIISFSNCFLDFAVSSVVAETPGFMGDNAANETCRLKAAKSNRAIIFFIIVLV